MADTHALTGEMLIGRAATRGSETSLRGVDPATGEELDPSYGGAGEADLERACALAEAAFDPYRETTLDERARFLETIAENILGLGDALVERAMRESGLPRSVRSRRPALRRRSSVRGSLRKRTSGRASSRVRGSIRRSDTMTRFVTNAERRVTSGVLISRLVIP